jgi:type II secretory pathway predicted ATPase ExeA/N-acetylmuramoyl-L-alanine amidase
MYLEFFKLWDEPFGVTPDPAYLYPSQTHLQALNSLREGIQGGRGFMTLIAEPGMGKTTLLYQLIEQLPQTARSAYLFQTQCNSLEFMQYLLNEIGVDPAGMGLVAMHRRLNEMLFNEMVQGKQFVLIVDESQNLSNAVLETIRLLSNFETAHSKLMQIVLAGQSDLANKLKQPDLSQLLQRITVMASLEAFSFEETAAYIRHRLKLAGHTGADLFDPAALAAVYRRSKGVPRNINRVCHAALTQAAAEQVRLVTAAIVEKANRGLGSAVEEPQRTRISNPPRPPAAPAPPAPPAGGHVAPSQANRDRVAPSDARAQVESRQPASQSPSWHFSPTPATASESSAPTPPAASARSSSFADASQPQSQIPPQPPPQSPLQQQFPPLPDFVPPEPRRRSYAWLAWAAVIVTIPILAALAAPANVRKALLQKIQASADSVASRNDPRPGASPQKNTIPATDPQPTGPTSDPANGVPKSGTARQGLKIVIDPGHGGADSGARGPNGLLEKSVCLEVALRLGQLIEDGLTGSEVIYTRSEDQNVSPARREAVAGESSADLFISIHADALGDGQGPQAYYFGGSARKKSAGSGRDESAEQVSQQLASDIQSALAHQFKSEATAIQAPKQPAFALLSGIRVPAVVVEIPFSGDTSPLRDPEQRQQIAEALYGGIAAFLKSPDRSTR